MWKEPPHIEQAVDLDSPWAKKYLELVSRPDSGIATEVHHIVPVAFYEDVLGVLTTRQSGTPDMIPGNLVKLSRGHHLLAHYYLYRCCRQCIRAQMASAVSMMLNAKDLEIRLSELTEEQVIELAHARDEAKAFTGWKVRKVTGGFIGKYLYENGEVTHGFILKPNGSVRKYEDRIHGFATDLDSAGVSMWAIKESVCIASTTGWSWNRKKMQYDCTGIPVVGNLFRRGDIPVMRCMMGVLTFKDIIKQFYPRYAKGFGGSWEQQLCSYRQIFPDIKPVEIVMPPKTREAA